MKAKKRERERILLLEDEPGLQRMIRFNLEEEGYLVEAYADAHSLLGGLQRNAPFSLGILDIMLPGEMDGLACCRRLRGEGFVFPVIFLSARSAVRDKLAGFEAGGDDYLAKPFDLDELLARVGARLRRREWDERDFSIGDFVVDLDAGQARSGKSGEVVRFGEREIRILTLLLRFRGQPVSRDLILDTVWGTAEFPTNRTVDNFIVKFRKVFEVDPRKPRHFITRHGVGYELAAEGS